jgi:hypothetical protein
LTASAIVFAAIMLLRWASLPPDLPDPSLKIRTGTPPVCVDKPYSSTYN